MGKVQMALYYYLSETNPMPQNENDATPGKLHSRVTSRVTSIDQTEADPGRRGFLQTIATAGVSVPASYFLLGNSARAAKSPGTQDCLKGNTSFALRRTDSTSKKAQFVRDFSDPYLELVRLLHEAAEVEHSLMIQYLYAAFSVKPEYAGIVGGIAPRTDTFLGFAVQEMQHLGLVNRLLAALGSTPNLLTQNMPYEPDIYPFEITLEACSPLSLAKYTYCEAPAGALDRTGAKDARDHAFLDTVYAALGNQARPNRVGSFYDSVIDTLKEYGKSQISEYEFSQPLDIDMWVEKLKALQEEGEVGHFEFFKDVLLGTHKGCRGRRNVWKLPRDHAHYPTQKLPANPSAFVGHPNQIKDPVALSLAWLSNLHYWVSLSALTYAYNFSSSKLIEIAQRHMIGPLLVLGRELPKLGAAVPFDQLSMGYSPGLRPADSLRFMQHLVLETIEAEKRLGDHLPTAYDPSITAATQEEIELLFEWMKVSRL
jgi:hypothetical protein